MSNPTLASRAFKPATPVFPLALLRDILQATPLAIFAQATKAALTRPRSH
jgi:hypothetical protein